MINDILTGQMCAMEEKMIRFINDLKKYYKFAVYSAKSELKAEIANSHLSWFWWILDPMLFMIVYSFIAIVVFNKSEPYFPVFVFIGYTSWSFFEKSIKSSVKLIQTNSSIVTKVYLPKFILILIKLFVNGFKMSISFALVVIMMIGYRIPFSPKMLWILPIFILLIIVTFGFSMILMHFGVFIEDLSNIINIGLKFVFYLSGIFYAVDKLDKRIPAPFNHLIVEGNPMALIIVSLRKVMLYNKIPDFLFLGIWLLTGIVLSIIGIYTIYKYENSYVKVI